MSRLRQRLGDDAREPAIIKTVRGEGYLLAANVAAFRRVLHSLPLPQP